MPNVPCKVILIKFCYFNEVTKNIYKEQAFIGLYSVHNVQWEHEEGPNAWMQASHVDKDKVEQSNTKEYLNHALG